LNSVSAVNTSLNVHSGNSTTLLLVTFNQLSDLSKPLLGHSKNSGDVVILLFTRLSELSKDEGHHYINSTTFSLELFDRLTELSTLSSRHAANSTTLYVVLYYENQTGLYKTTQRHSENSTSHVLITFIRLSELNSGESHHLINSTSYSITTFNKLSDLNANKGRRSSSSSTYSLFTDAEFNCSSMNGGLIDENTILITDLKSNGNCLTINSNNIVLDCAGHILFGRDNGTGILLNNKTNVTIRNCRIQNYGYGIYLNASDSNTLLNNTGLDNVEYDVYLNNSEYNAVINNSFCFIHNESSTNTITNNTCDISLEFLDVPQNFDVKRDFNTIMVQIKNTGKFRTKSVIGNVTNDLGLPMSFIGPGETANPTSLDVDEMKNFTIGLTLSDAMQLSYSVNTVLYWHGLVMASGIVNLTLPSWENYNISVTLGAWNVSMYDVSNSSKICLDTKKTFTITNTGTEPISDLYVNFTGLDIFLKPKINHYKLNVNESANFTAYIIANESTETGTGTIYIKGANLTEEIPVQYNKPPGIGQWANSPEFSADTYFTSTEKGFVCINNPSYCVTLNLPSAIDLSGITEATILMDFTDACRSNQPHDTHVYLNSNLVRVWNDTVLVGNYSFTVDRSLLNRTNRLCIYTYNYQGRGHFCANAGNTLRIKTTSYRVYCQDLACNATSTIESNFTDALDNDCDGKVDCDDLDSCGSELCNNTLICPPPENCFNGIDDDNNGLIDDSDLVCQKPDLQVTTNDIYPFTNKTGSVFINLTAHNIGYKNATNVTFELYEGNSTNGTLLLNTTLNLSSRTNQTLTFEWNVSNGTYLLFAILDKNNTIDEIDETNNNAIRLVNISALTLPDFYLNSSLITYTPENPVENELVLINATVYNLWVVNASNVTVQFLLDNSTIASLIASFDLGGSIILNTNWTAEIGEHNLTVVADPLNLIIESNESNNNGTKVISVYAVLLPDWWTTESNITFIILRGEE